MTTPTDLSTLRFEQIGSLQRPQALRDLHARFSDGTASAEEFRAAQDAAVRDVIAAQDARHLPILSDGEFHRMNFQDGFFLSVSGMERNPNMMNPPEGWVPGQYAQMRGPLELRGNFPLEEWQFAQALTDTPVKVTIVSPGQVALRVDPQPVYSSMDELMPAVVAAQRAVVDQLVAAGCPYLQVDAPSYSEYVDDVRRARAEEAGADRSADLQRDAAADNAIIANVGGAAVTAIHLCRGNFNDPAFLRTGGYDAIAEDLFNTLEHDRFLLEFDNERSGGFEPLRFVPKGKTVVLGLVTTKEATMEDPDTVKRRIDEASKFVPLEQLALSPQCGFSTAIRASGRMTEDDQWRKLELVRDIAADVWGTS